LWCFCDLTVVLYVVYHAAGIYGGFLLGVRSVSGLAFYDWETNSLVRRIEITPKMVSLRNTDPVCCDDDDDDDDD